MEDLEADSGDRNVLRVSDIIADVKSPVSEHADASAIPGSLPENGIFERERELQVSEKRSISPIKNGIPRDAYRQWVANAGIPENPGHFQKYHIVLFCDRFSFDVNVTRTARRIFEIAESTKSHNRHR